MNQDGSVKFTSQCKLAHLNKRECRKAYGSYPEEGEAWLVEDQGAYWSWEQWDHLMCLLDILGRVITE